MSIEVAGVVCSDPQNLFLKLAVSGTDSTDGRRLLQWQMREAYNGWYHTSMYNQIKPGRLIRKD